MTDTTFLFPPVPSMRSELGRFKRETLGEQLEEFGDELADFTNDFWSSLWGGRCLVDDSCAAGIAGCHRDDGIGKIQSSFETVKKAVRFDCNAPATYDVRDFRIVLLIFAAQKRRLTAKSH